MHAIHTTARSISVSLSHTHTHTQHIDEIGPCICIYIKPRPAPIYHASNTNDIRSLKERINTPSASSTGRERSSERPAGRAGFRLGMAAPALRVAILAAVLLLPFLSVPGAKAQTKKFCLTQFAIASQACAILPPTSPEHRHHDHDDEEEDENEDEESDDEDEDEDEDEDSDDSGGGGGGGDGGGGDGGGGGGGGGGGDRRHRDQHDKKSGVVSKPAASATKPAVASSMITVEAAEVDASTDDDDRNGTSHSVVRDGNHTRSGGGGSSSARRRHGSSCRRRRRRRHRRGRLRDGEDAEDEDEDEDEDEENEEDEDEDEDEDDDDDDDEDDHRAYRDCCRWLKEVEPDCVCEALLRLPPFLVRPQHKYTVKVGNSCKFSYRCGGV